MANNILDEDIEILYSAIEDNIDLLDSSIADFLYTVRKDFTDKYDEFFDERYIGKVLELLGEVLGTGDDLEATALAVANIIINEEGYFKKKTFKAFIDRLHNAEDYGGWGRPTEYMEGVLNEMFSYMDFPDDSKFNVGQEWTLHGAGIDGVPGYFVEGERYLDDLKKENKNYFVAICGNEYDIEYLTGKPGVHLNQMEYAYGSWSAMDSGNGKKYVQLNRCYGQLRATKDYCVLFVPVRLVKEPPAKGAMAVTYLTKDMLEMLNLPYWEG